MKKSDGTKNKLQLIWGFTLALAGISVFLRIPHVMPRIDQIQQFAKCTNCLRVCFCFIGFLLIIGGSSKIVKYFKP